MLAAVYQQNIATQVDIDCVRIKHVHIWPNRFWMALNIIWHCRLSVEIKWNLSFCNHLKEMYYLNSYEMAMICSVSAANNISIVISLSSYSSYNKFYYISVSILLTKYIFDLVPFFTMKKSFSILVIFQKQINVAFPSLQETWMKMSQLPQEFEAKRKKEKERMSSREKYI